MARTLPPAAVERLTSEPLMVHLATSVDDRPHVAPVWFVYDDGVFEVVTGGRKLGNLRRNPRVALSVQKDVAGDAQWVVTARGTARVVDDADATREATGRINRKYGAAPDAYAENTLVRISVGSAQFRSYE